jgi:opacity protein-like surface antigen
MNKMLLLIGAVVISGVVNAGERDTGFYVGGTVGSMSFDVDDEVDDDFGTFSYDIDDATAAGAIFGYEFGSGFSAEFQTTYAQPDMDIKLDGDTVLSGDFDYYTNSIYGVWRSPGKVYFKGKLGYSYQYAETEINYDDGSDEDVDWDDSGISYGVGVGVTFVDHLMVELEYTESSSDEVDMDFIGVSVAWHF